LPDSTNGNHRRHRGGSTTLVSDDRSLLTVAAGHGFAALPLG
jgi:hypothetical protein